MIYPQHPPAGIFVHSAQTHFDELDSLGVLHHSRYLRHLERATIALFFEMTGAEAFDPERYPDLYTLVRRVEIDYLVPLRSLTPFCILLRLERIREAATIWSFRFVSADGKVLYARGERTAVRMSLKTGEPAGWTPEYRAAAEQWLEWGRSAPWQ